jgi:hypothetical protein
MAINFPNTPILNQTFSSGNNTYIWNGSAWVGYSTVTSGGGEVTVSSQWVTAAAGIHTSSNVGIGTTNPTQSLTVNGVIRAGVSTFYTFQSSAGFTGDGSEGRYLQLGYQTNPNYILNNIGIGTTNATSKLTVQGTLSVSGVSTFNDNVVAPSITGNTIVLPGLNIYPITNGIDFFGGGTNFNIRQTLGTGGKFTISRNIGSPNLIAEFNSGGSVDLYYNASKKFETTNTGVTITGTTFTNQLNVSGVSNFNGLVGLGVTNPTSNLHVDGNGRFTGVVTATTFIGDGSGLTNIVATGTGIEIRDDGSVIGTASTINFGSNISVSQINAGIVTVSATPITTLPELSVTGIATLGSNSRVSGYFSASQLNVSTGATFGGSSTGFLEVKDSGFSNAYIAPGQITFNNVGGIQQIGTTQFFRASYDGSSLGAYYFSNYYGGFDHKVFYIDSNGATEIYYDENKKLETTSTGIVVTGVTTTNTLSVSGNSTISGNTSTNNLSVSNNVNVSGIVTANSFVGDGSQLTGISAGTLGVGTFAASIGVTTTIHTYAATNLVAEYTLFFQYNSTIQSQKVMVMNNGSTAYAQEYAIMYEPSQIVSVGATVSGSNVLLQVTPKSGITGITTFKYLAQVIS